MLPGANPGASPNGGTPNGGPQQDPPSSQGGGLLAASPDQLAAQAQMQQAPAAPPELSMGAKSLIEDVVSELRRRYRDPSFTVPLSIKEPPITTQLPGLIEGGAQKPIAFPSMNSAANMNPAMGLGMEMGAGMPADPLAGLLGGAEAAVDPLAAMGMGAGGGMPAGPDPSRILNSGPQAPGQPSLGFNPEDVLLM